jgi:hypothetical protein
MAEWTIDPKKWADGCIENIDDVRRIYAFKIFESVVNATPVHDKDYGKRGKERKKQYTGGRTRQNWLVTINQETNEFDPNKKKGGRVLSNGEEVINAATGDDTIIMQNNAPNINMLEYGGWPKVPKRGSYTIDGLPKTENGFSRQAPKGMVGKTLAQAERIFKAAIAAANGGEHD